MKRKAPSEQECRRYWQEFSLPDNVLRHVSKVSELALYLGKQLKEAGEHVDLNLLQAGALLHDLDKLQTKDGGHGQKTAEFLAKEGYPEVAGIVQKHVLTSMDSENPPKTWEEKLVYYADKRVLDDRVASVKDRLDYIENKYNGSKEDRGRFESQILAVEKEIFGRLKIRPEEIRVI